MQGLLRGGRGGEGEETEGLKEDPLSARWWLCRFLDGEG